MALAVRSRGIGLLVATLRAASVSLPALSPRHSVDTPIHGLEVDTPNAQAPSAVDQQGHMLEVCGFNDLAAKGIWADYEKFHHEGKEKLIQGDSSVQALIWHCDDTERLGGNGDQIKGLTTAFYFALVTRRVFLIQNWEVMSQDMLELLAPRKIDWRMHSSLLSSCRTTSNVTNKWGDHSSDEKPLLSWAKQFDNTQCVRFQSVEAPENLKPELQVAGMDQEIERMAQVFETVQYRRGCAFNFLFKRQDDMLHYMQVQSPFPTSMPFIGIHLRFGDAHMVEGEPDAYHDDRMREDPQYLIEALDCARKVQAKFFSADTKSGILVLTDSYKMKKLLADKTWLSQHAGYNPQTEMIDTTHDADGSVFVPAHTGHEPQRVDVPPPEDQQKQTTIRAWADQLNLVEARALVMTSSGFGQTALEIGLMDAEQVYVFHPGSSCEPSPQQYGPHLWQRPESLAR